MIKAGKVLSINYEGRTLQTYSLICDGKPLFAPSLFLLDLARGGKAIGTNRTYANCLKRFFTVISESRRADGNYPDWRNINDREMSGYLYGELKQNSGLKDSSIDLHVAALEEFYKFAAETGLIKTKPAFSYSYKVSGSHTTRSKSVSTKLHKAYIDEANFEIEVLSKVKAKSPFITERDELVLCLGYYAGFRSHEVVIPSNLDAKKMRKLLPKKDKWQPESIKLDVLGKGGKLRTVPLPVKLVERIYRFLWGRARDISDGSLICRPNGTPLTDDQFASNLFADCRKKILASNACDKDAWQERSYHILRKCFGTNAVAFCYNNGFEPWVFVPQWMGHENKETTFIYIFFDALLYQRLDVLNKLSLENTAYGKKYQQQKTGNQPSEL